MGWAAVRGISCFCHHADLVLALKQDVQLRQSERKRFPVNIGCGYVVGLSNNPYQGMVLLIQEYMDAHRYRPKAGRADE